MKTLIQLLLLVGLCAAATGCKNASKTETSRSQVSDSTQMPIPSTAAVKADNDIQTAKPFKGDWSCEEAGEYFEESGLTHGKYYFYLSLDFYEKTVMFIDEPTHGFYNINTDRHVENNEISSFKINGNQAIIEYEDGNGDLCNATLIYNPTDKSMEFIDGKIIKKASEGEGFREFHLAMDRILQFQKK